MEAESEYARVAYTFWHVWAPIRMLSRCLLNKISASELSRKFVESALLLVGKGRKGMDMRTWLDGGVR